MASHPVTSSRQHSKSLHDTQYWEDILRDAGLPPEPPPQRNTYSLPKDSQSDFLVNKSFFDRHSDAIFEARQDWKRAGVVKCECQFCKYVFWDRKGTKFCCDNHRKRHHEGKVYKKVMCATEGCVEQVVWFRVPEGETLCWRCAVKRDFCAKAGYANYEEYLAFGKRKHEEYLAIWQKQQEQLHKMRSGNE